MPIDVVCPCGWKRTDGSTGTLAKCPNCNAALPIPQLAEGEIDTSDAALMEIGPRPERPDRPTEEELGPTPGEYSVGEAPDQIRGVIHSKPQRRVARKRRRVSPFAGLQIPTNIDVAGSLALMLFGGVVIAVQVAMSRTIWLGIAMTLFGLFRLIRVILGRKD